MQINGNIAKETRSKCGGMPLSVWGRWQPWIDFPFGTSEGKKTMNKNVIITGGTGAHTIRGMVMVLVAVTG